MLKPENLFKEEPYKIFINGEYIESISKKTFVVENPYTNKKIATVFESDKADVNQAIESAESGLKHWKEYDSDKKASILEKFAELFGNEIDRLAYMEMYQTGRPIREMKSQLSRLPEWFKYYASLLRTMEDKVFPFGDSHHVFSQKSPLGVVGLITPWNHPLLILTKKLAPALAAGNSVIIKPSELTPITTLELGEIANKAGFPKGVINVIPGFGQVAGAALTGDNRIAKIDITGGTQTGKKIAEIAGSNLTQVSCELGGKTSVLFFEDMDIDRSVNAAAFASFIASGQTCVQGSRLLVQESIYTEFVDKFIKKVKNIKIGDPASMDTQMGPLVSENQKSIVENYTKIALEEGATLAYGGETPKDYGNSNFFKPTVFTDVKGDMRIAQEEVFGPITVIIPFKNEEHALEIANNTEFGLGMGVWTNELSKAFYISENLESGIVWINDHHRIDPASPWGGIKLSGIGKENGIKAFLSYTNEKTIIINKSKDNFDWYSDGTIQRYS